jgi:hypothetical protein
LINGWKQGKSFEEGKTTLYVITWLNGERNGVEMCIVNGKLQYKFNFINGHKHGIALQYALQKYYTFKSIITFNHTISIVELYDYDQWKIRIHYDRNEKIHTIHFHNH